MWEANEEDKRVRGEELEGTRERQMMWEEVRFVMARLKKMIRMLKEEFGEKVPMVSFLVFRRQEVEKEVEVLITRSDVPNRYCTPKLERERREYLRVGSYLPVRRRAHRQRSF